MYELVRAGENTYYFDCPAKVGVVRFDGDRAVLIDSGGDKGAGKKILQELEAQGWQLTAIFNTHYHADHIGGNRYLQEKTGCRIYVPGCETAFVRSPELESALLYGGCPCEDLRGKFLMAPPSDAEQLTPEALPAGMEAIRLAGHSPEMTGYRTPDGVVFLGDCLTEERVLEKYGIPYLYDVANASRTLEEVARMEAPLFIPSHAPATKDPRPLVERNQRQMEETVGQILRFCAQPRDPEEIIAHLFRLYGLTINFTQYVLVGSTIRSYLAFLRDKKALAPSFSGKKLLWTALSPENGTQKECFT